MATVVFGDFEWDDRKAASNARKHGVSFEEALSALADPKALTAPDIVDVQSLDHDRALGFVEGVVRRAL